MTTCRPRRAHRPLQAWALSVALSAGAWLAACAPLGVVSPVDPQAELPDRTAHLTPGQTPRSQVRAVMGEPLVHSPAWGFELYRAEAEQHQTLIAVTPWPVPFARVADHLQRYTLVTYDAAERVQGRATGLFRRPADWRSASPIERDFMALHLRVGDLLLFIDPEGERQANLLAAPPVRDDYLQRSRTSSGCTIVMGCGATGCANRLAVDDGAPSPLPLRLTQMFWLPPAQREDWLRGLAVPDPADRFAWLEALVAVSLAPGEHVLRFSARSLGGEGVLPLTCRPGALQYLVMHARDDGSRLRHALVDWHFDLTDAPPPSFLQRPLVLRFDGRCLVPQ